MTKNLLKSFDFQSNLTELLELLLESEELTIPQIECLVKFSKQANLKKFNVAVKDIPRELGKKLLKVCQTKLELLQELITLLAYDEEQVVKFIGDDTREDQLFCCQLLDTKQFKLSQALMKKLTPASRSQYLQTILQNSEIEKAITLLNSGEILPDTIDLTKMTKRTLHSQELLSALLNKKVNPCGLSGPPSPLTQLVHSFPKQVNKKTKELYCEIVKTISLLVDAGADVEDLCNYHTGHKTTPLHVAIEMALTTGML